MVRVEAMLRGEKTVLETQSSAGLPVQRPMSSASLEIKDYHD